MYSSCFVLAFVDTYSRYLLGVVSRYLSVSALRRVIPILVTSISLTTQQNGWSLHGTWRRVGLVWPGKELADNHIIGSDVQHVPHMRGGV